MTRVILTIFFGLMLLASFSVQANGRDGYHTKQYQSHNGKHKRHHNKHHGCHGYQGYRHGNRRHGYRHDDYYRHGDRRHGYRHNDYYRHARYAQSCRGPYLGAGAYFEYSNDGVVLVYQSYPQGGRGY